MIVNTNPCAHGDALPRTGNGVLRGVDAMNADGLLVDADGNPAVGDALTTPHTLPPSST